MSLLEHPTAQALLGDAEVSAADVRGCRRGLERFLRRYLPRFYREEQRELAQVILQGKLSNLQRKTSEPIAYLANRERKPVQHFVGAGAWDDESVMAELRRHVAETRADPNAVLVVDGSGFAKKGNASCGVARQWCGRLGKVENCQVGVFLAYVTAEGYAPLDRRLYLPDTWAEDSGRREETHVPEEVTFQECWRIGLDLLERSGPDVPFGWVAGDDEFGRASAFRAALRERGLRYVLDVPSTTSIRAWARRRPPGIGCRRGGGLTRGPKRTVLTLASPGGRRRGQRSASGAGVGDVGAGQRREGPGRAAGAVGGHPNGGRGISGLVHPVECQ